MVMKHLSLLQLLLVRRGREDDELIEELIGNFSLAWGGADACWYVTSNHIRKMGSMDTITVGPVSYHRIRKTIIEGHMCWL